MENTTAIQPQEIKRAKVGSSVILTFMNGNRYIGIYKGVENEEIKLMSFFSAKLPTLHLSDLRYFMVD